MPECAKCGGTGCELRGEHYGPNEYHRAWCDLPCSCLSKPEPEAKEDR